MIHVGDLIEAIDHQSTVGCRHYQVAKMLKDIELGTTFDLTIVEPQKAFGIIFFLIFVCFVFLMVF